MGKTFKNPKKLVKYFLAFAYSTSVPDEYENYDEAPEIIKISNEKIIKHYNEALANLEKADEIFASALVSTIIEAATQGTPYTQLTSMTVASLTKEYDDIAKHVEAMNEEFIEKDKNKTFKC